MEKYARPSAVFLRLSSSVSSIACSRAAVVTIANNILFAGTGVACLKVLDKVGSSYFEGVISNNNCSLIVRHPIRPQHSDQANLLPTLRFRRTNHRQRMMRQFQHQQTKQSQTRVCHPLLPNTVLCRTSPRLFEPLQCWTNASTRYLGLICSVNSAGVYPTLGVSPSRNSINRLALVPSDRSIRGLPGVCFRSRLAYTTIVFVLY